MLLKNLTNSQNKKIHILIKDEKIEKIFSADEILPSDAETKDYGGKHVFSGIIDPHVHMRDPGLTQKEDFSTGTKAAAKGGITTVFEMPNTLPPVSTYDLFLEKRRILKNKSYINYGLYFAGTSEDNSAEVRRVFEHEGKVMLKIFLNASTGNLLVEDEKTLLNLFSSAETVFVHAEDEMTKRAIEITKKAGNKLYVCHVATAYEVDEIRRAKAEMPGRIFAEVTPHHLFLTEQDMEKDEESRMLLQMRPALKSKKDVESLWKAIEDGTVDTVGTDHAPHLLQEKLAKLTFGIPGVETSLALMLTAYKEGKIPLQSIEELMSENPAKILGLKAKGKLWEGYDADITIVDFEEWILKETDIVSKCAWSPFTGRKFRGRAFSTIVAGKIVYEDGKFLGEKIGREII